MLQKSIHLQTGFLGNQIKECTIPKRVSSIEEPSERCSSAANVVVAPPGRDANPWPWSWPYRQISWPWDCLALASSVWPWHKSQGHLPRYINNAYR